MADAGTADLTVDAAAASIAERPASRTARSWPWLAATWLVCGVYAGRLLLRGWVPHDEGTFAETATRVLAGELPHRDFQELYTGGLSYLHALAFRLLGTNLASLRIMLFVWFLAWVPAVYYVASRFVVAHVAAAVTLLAVAWSVPNYAAAVPSWYNLFFATFGVAAVLAHLDSGARGWLFVAGLCGGLSVLAKSPGVYYVAGVVLFCVFREQSLAAARPDGTRRARAYPWLLACGLLLFVAALRGLVSEFFGTQALVQFVVPSATLATLLLWREWRGVPGDDRERFGTLAHMLAPFALGVALPLALLLVPYLVAGSLDALTASVAVSPMKRLSFAVRFLPFLRDGATVIPVLLVLAAAMGPPWLRRTADAVAVAAAAAVIVLSPRNEHVHVFAWHTLDLVPPLIVAAGAVWIARSSDARRSQQLMLLLSVLALANLVRFPFSAPIYFCYVAPLVVLAGTALFASFAHPPRVVLGAILGFYLLFAVMRITPSFIYVMGLHYEPDMQTTRLAMPRAGGLRVSAGQAAEYDALIALVQRHAAGEFIYAGPDCPEVYFLSGLRNPTPTMFDFFDDEASGRAERILAAIDARNVRVVALLERPGFSRRDRALEVALAERFPRAERVGRFQVRWR